MSRWYNTIGETSYRGHRLTVAMTPFGWKYTATREDDGMQILAYFGTAPKKATITAFIQILDEAIKQKLMPRET